MKQSNNPVGLSAGSLGVVEEVEKLLGCELKHRDCAVEYLTRRAELCMRSDSVRRLVDAGDAGRDYMRDLQRKWLASYVDLTQHDLYARLLAWEFESKPSARVLEDKLPAPPTPEARIRKAVSVVSDLGLSFYSDGFDWRLMFTSTPMWGCCCTRPLTHTDAAEIRTIVRAFHAGWIQCLRSTALD